MGGREHSQLEYSCSLCLDVSPLSRWRRVVVVLRLASCVCGLHALISISLPCPSGLALEKVEDNPATYLLTGVSAAGDDGDSADLEELHFDVVCRRVNMKLWRGLVDLAL